MHFCADKGIMKIPHFHHLANNVYCILGVLAKTTLKFGSFVNFNPQVSILANSYPMLEKAFNSNPTVNLPLNI
jgi:hypothetical protein